MHNLPRILEKIKRLAAACRDEIDASERPLDGIPVQWVIPLFFVHPDHAESWHQRVVPEIWERLRRLRLEPEPLVIPEGVLQRTPFALSHAETQQIRNGALLKMLNLTNLRFTRQRGGRVKRHVELAIREALESEVFRRDPEIGALISCMRARFDGVDLPVTKGAGLNALVELAWAAGVPTKGRAADKDVSEEDRRLALFETLRSEGEKRATAWLPGLTAPAEAEANIVAQVRDRARAALSRAEFENAIKVAASWVRTLMKACAHVTEVAEEKHKLAKRSEKVAALRRPPKDNNPFHWEPITHQQHSLFTKNEFSAVELAFIAVAADVDPNLVSSNHVLATPEFRVARKLGRAGRGHQTTFEPDEISDLQIILGRAGHADCMMYQDVHRYLAECASELLPVEAWMQRLAGALANRIQLVLPD